MILYGKPVIEAKKPVLKEFFVNSNSYIAILFFGDNEGSKVYVRNKVKFGEEIGCGVKVIDDVAMLQCYNAAMSWDVRDPYIVKQMICDLNLDESCLWILIQLPLPDDLKPFQQELCDMIDPKKDIDCMTSSMLGAIAAWRTDVVYPAAVGASIEMLKYYGLHNLKWKQVSILGQSNLIGKPMALYCINQGAQVHSFGVDWDKEIMREICRKSDYIISATGVVGLIDESFISPWFGLGALSLDAKLGNVDAVNLQFSAYGSQQVIIDIGYGFTPEGKAAGDVKFDEVKDLAVAVSPVPGGVGPMCVCQLFENARQLVAGY